MDTCRNVVFLDELLDQVDLIGRWFDGDGADTKRFGEIKHLTRSSLITWDAHHTKVHDEQAVLLRLGFEFLDGFVRGVWIDLGLFIRWAKRLARVELNRPAACRSGPLDGFKCGEAMKHVSLAAEDKAADPILWANGGLSRVCVKRENSRGDSRGAFHQVQEIHSVRGARPTLSLFPDGFI